MVILKSGYKIRLLVARGLCPCCHHLHTELPNFIQPYKHYEAQVIQDVVDNKSQAVCPADEATMRRWSAEFLQMAPHIETLLRSCQECAYPLFGASLLEFIRQTKRRWASFVLPLLCAAHFYPSTRFACCPGG